MGWLKSESVLLVRVTGLGLVGAPARQARPASWSLPAAASRPALFERFG